MCLSPLSLTLTLQTVRGLSEGQGHMEAGKLLEATYDL